MPASPEPVQPAKKRRIEEVIDAKLSAIRQSMESADQPSQTTQDCGNDEAQEPNNSNKKNKKKNKKNNKKNGAANNATKQSSGKPVEFDYSKVDYKQFQGGSQKPKPETEFKSKFHGKVCLQGDRFLNARNCIVNSLGLLTVPSSYICS